MQGHMNPNLRIGCLAVAFFSLGCASVTAQGPKPARAGQTFECATNAHCSISCMVDGEKAVQTGSPKTVTVTELARNNYLVEVVEQSGHVQFAYLAGAKVVCTLEGMTKAESQ